MPSVNPDPNMDEGNESRKIVFTVAPADNPRYWRVDAYDTYTGKEWKQSSPDIAAYRQGDLIPSEVRAAKSMHNYTYSVVLSQQSQGGLPAALHTKAAFNLTGTGGLGVNSYGALYSFGQAKSYSFTMCQYNYSRETLLSAGGSEPLPPGIAQCLQLPAELPERVREAALNKTAGVSGLYEKAMLLASYLKSSEFKYKRTPGEPQGSDWADWFLFKAKKGKCNDFTTAFVVLARSAGIPCRYAAGFAIGETSGSQRIVRSGHAHTWAEVHLGDAGWVPFEVTGTNFDDPDDIGPAIDGSDPTVIGGGTGGGTAGPRGGKPDLRFVDEVRASSGGFTKDRRCKLYATVKNSGNGTSPPALVRFVEHRGSAQYLVSPQYIPSLPQDGEYYATFNWTPVLSGAVDLTGQIDPENAIEELNETNNNITRPIYVQSGIDISVSFSDIQIYPASPIERQAASIRVIVHNLGNIPVLGRCSVGIYDNGNEVGYLGGLTVNGFSWTTAIFAWTPETAGTHAFQIRASPGSATMELDWGNNNLSVPVTVRKSIDIVKVVWEDLNGDMLFGRGDTVTVTVQNNMNSSTYVSVTMLYLVWNLTRTQWSVSGNQREYKITISFNHVDDTTEAKIIVYAPISAAGRGGGGGGVNA